MPDIYICETCLHADNGGEDLRLLDPSGVIRRAILDDKLPPDTPLGLSFGEIVSQYANDNNLSVESALDILTGEPSPWALWQDAAPRDMPTPYYCVEHYGEDSECREQCGIPLSDDDGYQTFNRMPCEGCGSRLAGSRYRYRG